MRWPWRRKGNGKAARAARDGATEQLREARDKGPQVEQLALAAHELVRRTDRLARDVERALRSVR